MGEKRIVYADHAATTPLSEAAWRAMQPFMGFDFGNPGSLHSFGRKPREAVEAARATIAECIGASPEEIYFTSGGTEANNWAVKRSKGGLMVSSYEHHSILNAAADEAARGRLVCYCSPKMSGNVFDGKIATAWKDGVELVSVMAANNEIGALNAIWAITGNVHKRGARFHTDAVQAVGHVEVDVEKWGVDYLSASAHKFNGPRGIGFLYMRKGCELEPLIHGGGQERGLRAGTENVAGIVGMAAALRENCENMERNEEYLLDLKMELMEGLERICGDVEFPGSRFGFQLPGFVCASFPGKSAEAIVHLLDLKGVAVSAGAACNSRSTEVSHVLTAIRLPQKLALGTVRISLGIENSMEDVRAILAAVKSAVGAGGAGGAARN